jgi:hypothetical protein
VPNELRILVSADKALLDVIERLVGKSTKNCSVTCFGLVKVLSALLEPHLPLPSKVVARIVADGNCIFRLLHWIPAQ